MPLNFPRAGTHRPSPSVRYNTGMSQSASAIVRSPAEIVQNSPVSQAPNGICFARSGEITIADNDLERMIAAVPVPVAAALSRKAYYFVPLTVTQLGTKSHLLMTKTTCLWDFSFLM